MVKFSHPYITGKTIALTIWTFVGKVMPLLFNTLSRFVIDFFPSSKHLLISWLQSPSNMIVDFLLTKVHSQSCGFSSSHVWMWQLDHKGGWALKNWCLYTVVLEKTLESPLDSKKIKPINPKGNQPWIFIGRTDVETEAPILWPLDAKNWLIGKDPNAGKDWRQEEKGTTEDEMVGWHHWLNGHEFKHTPRDSEGQGSLFCCSSWSHKVSDMT